MGRHQEEGFTRSLWGRGGVAVHSPGFPSHLFPQTPWTDRQLVQIRAKNQEPQDRFPKFTPQNMSSKGGETQKNRLSVHIRSGNAESNKDSPFTAMPFGGLSYTHRRFSQRGCALISNCSLSLTGIKKEWCLWWWRCYLFIRFCFPLSGNPGRQQSHPLLKFSSVQSLSRVRLFATP